MIYIFGPTMKHAPFGSCEVNVVLSFCSGQRMIDYTEWPRKVKFDPAQSDSTVWVKIYIFSWT